MEGRREGGMASSVLYCILYDQMIDSIISQPNYCFFVITPPPPPRRRRRNRHSPLYLRKYNIYSNQLLFDM